MRLIDLGYSNSGTVSAVSGDTLSVERLEEMGLSIGRHIVLVRKIPFGGPFVVLAGSTFIALRASEAEFIEVEPTQVSVEAK